MKRSLTLTVFAVFFAGLLMSGLALRRGAARDASIASVATTQPACNSATLNGAYRYTFSGQGFPAAGPIHPTGASLPFAAAGIINFSGDGTLSGHDTASLSGATLHRVYTGTYSVNSDCTGSVTLNFCPNNCSGPADLVVAPDGSEALFINTIRAATVLGELKKQ